MANLRPKARVQFELTLALNESEARALDALAGYGDDAFLKVFYEHTGKAYLQPHEAGLRSLFCIVRDVLGAQLAEVDSARRVLRRETASHNEGTPNATE